MTSNYEARARKFIAAIYPYICECTDPWEYEQAITIFLRHHPSRRIDVYNGLTRVAIITSDYVIKIDYDPDSIKQFGGCEAEVKVYADAKRAHMEYLFAKITPYNYNGQMFYIMPRIYGIGLHEDVEAYEFMNKKETDWCSAHGICDLHEYNYGFYKGQVILIDYGASR